jgi:integrase
VLVDELGAPQRTDWLRRRAYALMATAGVRKVRLYNARHSCLTYLAVNGGASHDRQRVGRSQ